MTVGAWWLQRIDFTGQVGAMMGLLVALRKNMAGRMDEDKRGQGAPPGLLAR